MLVNPPACPSLLCQRPLPPLDTMVIAGILKCMAQVCNVTWICHFFYAAKMKVCSLCKPLPPAADHKRVVPSVLGGWYASQICEGRLGSFFRTCLDIDGWRQKFCHRQFLILVSVEIFSPQGLPNSQFSFTVAHTSVTPVRLWGQNQVCDVRMPSTWCQWGQFQMRRESTKLAKLARGGKVLGR